ncbi:hypothetical protein PARMER_00006 [Parabacteroides merdae ATCC 43184]|nr:hypothetical protein PARMER_00006 [Parabacteroides merdae ATCC 43184]HBN19807.1 hypothetical protein [Parabacteroides merdae]
MNNQGNRTNTRKSHEIYPKKTEPFSLKTAIKIGKTGWFLLSGKALLLPDIPMLPPLTPGCTDSLHPDVKDGNMGVFTELSACFC